MKSNEHIGQFLETLDTMDREGKRIPGLIMSSPGFGKTTTIETWCNLKDYNLTTLIASNFSSDDILGLQAVKDGNLVRLTPSWFNSLVDKAKNGKRNVLFLDEISAADAYIQAPLFNLIFNHDLAGKSLPENTMIVAAGNYSEELGNAFKMTAPLVNRFLILNLVMGDYSFTEILNNNGINSIKDPEELKSYIGIKDKGSRKWSFDRFRQWVSDNRSEFKVGKSEFVEDLEMGGLLGFISLRSFSYVLSFAETYMSKFNDEIWIRILGDTLGMSNRREGKPIRDVLLSQKPSFYKLSDNISSELSSKKIEDICKVLMTIKDINSKEASEALDALEDKACKASVETISSKDLSAFSNLKSKYLSNERLSKIGEVLINKMG